MLADVRALTDEDEHRAALDGSGEWTPGAKRSRGVHAAEKAARDAQARELAEKAGPIAGSVGMAATLQLAGFDRKSCPSVTVGLANVLGVKALDLPDVDSWNVARTNNIGAFGQDARFLSDALVTQSVSGETAVFDFVQSGDRTVTGTVDARSTQ